MRRTRPALLAVIVAAAAACGGGGKATSAPTQPVAMRPTPRAALALCQRSVLLRPACPQRVPVGQFAHARRPPGYTGAAAGGAIAFCSKQRSAVTSYSCADASWILEAGAPAGLPPDAPPGVPGKRLPPAKRTRPPQYVHLIVYATHGSVGHRISFAWPRGRAETTRDALLRTRRTKPVLLGTRDWGGKHGTLVLAPPLLFGGENGDHLLFRWRRDGDEYLISLHSWAPLREAEVTLEAIVTSAR